MRCMSGTCPGRQTSVPSIVRDLDDPVRIAQGKRQRGAVEVDNHPGDGGIDICCDPVLVAEDHTGSRITIIPEFLIRKKQQRADRVGHFCAAMGHGYQERVAFFHRYQQMDIGRDILLTFGCRQLRSTNAAARAKDRSLHHPVRYRFRIWVCAARASLPCPPSYFPFTYQPGTSRTRGRVPGPFCCCTGRR